MKPFYFVRHGETDFNVKRIFHDGIDAPLNEKGRSQAESIRPIVETLSIKKIYRSPLKRVEETHAIITKNISFETSILHEFTECPGDTWKKLVAWELAKEKKEFCPAMNTFCQRIKRGLEIIQKDEGPILIVAHGGSYWMLSHILDIQNSDRRVANCGLLHFYPDPNGSWQVESISTLI